MSNTINAAAAIAALDEVRAERDRLRRKVEVLSEDIAGVEAQADRHHTPLPGTWPWERVKAIVDDNESLRDALRKVRAELLDEGDWIPGTSRAHRVISDTLGDDE